VWHEDGDHLRWGVAEVVQVCRSRATHSGVIAAEEHPTPSEREPRDRTGLAEVQPLRETLPPPCSQQPSDRVVTEPVAARLVSSQHTRLRGGEGKEAWAWVDAFLHIVNLLL
jgi:hypothetical protein